MNTEWNTFSETTDVPLLVEIEFAKSIEQALKPRCISKNWSVISVKVAQTESCNNPPIVSLNLCKEPEQFMDHVQQVLKKMPMLPTTRSIITTVAETISDNRFLLLFPSLFSSINIIENTTICMILTNSRSENVLQIHCLSTTVETETVQPLPKQRFFKRWFAKKT